MSRIQSALVGSVKPIRNDSGYDITEATIGTKAQQLGIETSVRNLNQMEKRLLRIIVLMDQMRSTGAMQDLARTIEQPANQIKILKNQVQELGVWLGNVFIGTISQILPYINGFLMALVAIVKTLAVFVGYTNTGSGLAEGLEEAQEASTGIASGIGGAANSAKELRKSLMGFDVLNVIQKPQESSGGGGGGGASGSLGTINPAILNALKDYDNLMDKVKMKATDIRDRIMEWLGFTKEINPLTGEISWKLNDGLTNFEKILDVVKIIGVTIASWKVSSSVLKFFEHLGVLNSVQSFTMALGFTLAITGIYASYKGTEHLLDGDIDTFSLLETLLGMGAGTLGFISILNATKYGQLFYLGEKIKIGLGLMLIIQGFQISQAGVDKDNIKLQVGGLLESAFGGYLIGSSYGGWKIGLVISLVATITNITTQVTSSISNVMDDFAKKTWGNMDEYIEQGQAVSKTIDSLKAQRDEIEKNMALSLAQIEYSKGLVVELGNLVDSNGKVYEGYEDRVKFILENLNNAYGTEYELVNGQITQNGKLITSYEDMKKKIYEVIEAKKAQIIAEANEEAYSNALKNRMQLYVEMKKAEDAHSKAVQEAYENYGYLLEKGEEFPDKVKDELEKLQKEAVKAKNAYKDNTKDIIYYEQLQTAIISGDSKKIQQAISDITSTYETEEGKVSASLADRIRDNKEYSDSVIEIYKELGQEVDEQTMIALKAQEQAIIDSLVEQTKSIKELTPDQVDAWKALADTDYDAYVDALDDLPPETQKMIQDATGKVIKGTQDALPQVEKAATNIKDVITKNMDGTFSINFNAQADYHELANKLREMRNIVERMANIPIVGSAFVKYKNNLDNLINQLPRGYAQGGFPDMGELFVAREAGPELVGSIGGRNAVVNNDQIVEAVSSGVANAVASVLGNGGSSYQLIIDGEQITNVVQRRLSRRANITGMAMGV